MKRNKIRRFALALLANPIFNLIIFIAILFSLLFWDIAVGWWGENLYWRYVSGIYICFALFATELILMVLAHKKIYKKVGWWLLLFSTTAMILEFPIFGGTSGISQIIVSNLIFFRFMRAFSRLARLIRLLIHIIEQSARSLFSGLSKSEFKLVDRMHKLANQRYTDLYNKMETSLFSAITVLVLILFAAVLLILENAHLPDGSSFPMELKSQVIVFVYLFILIVSFFFQLFSRWFITKFSLKISGTLTILVTALEEKDPYTKYHSRHVAKLAQKLGEKMGLSKTRQKQLRVAGELHDVGKIGVPESILNKKGSLSTEEFEIMKKHVTQGLHIINPLCRMKELVVAAYYHHERYDGSGYPEGLKGDEIPRLSSILAICDVWDALISDRPYRKALPVEVAKNIIRDESGKSFKPEIVESFLDMIEKQLT